jgi:hypothetical protein
MNNILFIIDNVLYFSGINSRNTKKRVLISVFNAIMIDGIKFDNACIEFNDGQIKSNAAI